VTAVRNCKMAPRSGPLLQFEHPQQPGRFECWLAFLLAAGAYRLLRPALRLNCLIDIGPKKPNAIRITRPAIVTGPHTPWLHMWWQRMA